MLNRTPENVRKSVEDRRVVRTRRALGVALVELMMERDFEEITVQQLLDRAGVGRATFYAHFRNKHDLILSDAERYFDLLERNFHASAGGTKRLAPVAELFEHVAEYRHFREALERSSMRAPMFDLLTGYLAGMIERRIGEEAIVSANRDLPPKAIARMLAAALVEMMRWWLTHPGYATAREMEARFHRIAWEGLARIAPRAQGTFGP